MKMSASSQASVAILMCTYNGDKYLREQLESIDAQTHQNWSLVVSDDGSTDDTLSILNEYRQRWGGEKIDIRKGPQRGFCQNFLSLAVDSEIDADYFAFSDQDDIWLIKKLEVAVAHIAKNESVPCFYCGRTSYVKNDLMPYAKSPLYVFPGGFRNALVQSIAGGNTMVFNKSAKKLIESAGLQSPVSHDWWIYQLVTGAGGKVCYDSEPQILYRQHAGSIVGSNDSVWSRVERIVMMLQGRFKMWTDQNLSALDNSRSLLSYESTQILDLFIRLRQSSVKDRFKMLEVCGLYRQTWSGTVSLLLAALFRKI